MTYVRHMADNDTVFTAEAATILGVSQSTVLRMVDRGDLSPVVKAPGLRGAYGFLRADVEALTPLRHTA
jgi:excisionase family DNA binding protein